MKKQRKIAAGLKLLVLVLALMGFFVFGRMTQMAVCEEGELGKLMHTSVGFTWFIAVLCYLVLYQFYKVCGEIGKDNSFSIENAKSFHCMGMIGVVAAISYVVKLIYLAVTGGINVFWIEYCIFFAILSVMFTGLCEALGALIKNAYEMKQENDLTI